MPQKLMLDQLVRVATTGEYPVLSSWDEGFPEIARRQRFDKLSTFKVEAIIKGLPAHWIIAVHKGSGEYVAFPASAVESAPTYGGLLRR